MYEAKLYDGRYFIIKRNNGQNHCVCVPSEKENRLMKIMNDESKLQTLYLFILAKGGKECIWNEFVTVTPKPQPPVQRKTKKRNFWL